ncbi:hypothetical protein F2Q70_00016195 [Brassica cretica]|uniref:Uncharacterized protein n=1 Tax=Brassica cretica TaxID=69181 RepID=A0A8S9I2R4_BRACR|nr:hypothetical protein F2Q70_00016195 [Brassica cretica]
MFSKWDFDVEDKAAKNILKLMFNSKPKWKWTMDFWELTGTDPWVNPQLVYVKKEESAAKTEAVEKEDSGSEDSGREDSGRPRKKSHKDAHTEARKEAHT